MNNIQWKVGDAGKTRGGVDYVVTSIAGTGQYAGRTQPIKATIEGYSPCEYFADGLFYDVECPADLLPPTHNVNTGERYWIVWAGGTMPVPAGTLVDVKHRDGCEHLGVEVGERGVYAEDWSHDGSSGDIIAYRIAAPAKADASPKPLRLQVGKKYRARNGEVVTIDRTDTGHSYGETNPFMAGSLSYREDGRYFPGGEYSNRDLIEEIADEQPAAEPWEVAMMGDEFYFRTINLFRAKREGDKWRMFCVDTGDECITTYTDEYVRESFRRGAYKLADKPAEGAEVPKVHDPDVHAVIVDGGITHVTQFTDSGASELAELNRIADDDLRDEIANGVLLSCHHDGEDAADAARIAFDYADAFMAERARRYGNT